jgi:hypothetical protein
VTRIKEGLSVLFFVDVELAGAIGANYKSNQIALPCSKDGQGIARSK